jgi:O-acetyl-ADP-ribose deacetylase (regulator of RNase III)
MTTLTLHTGDLFTTTADGIAHGINTAGVMGSGIAPYFKRRYDGMFDAYRVLCLNGHLHGGETFIWQAPEVTVYNIASQEEPGRNASLPFLEQGVRAALIHADAHGVKTIALPRIGCGIGGLDWADVEPVLRGLAAEFVCDVAVWTLP